jgi:WD40 repeat protein
MLLFSAVLGKSSFFVFAFIWSGHDWKKKYFYIGSVFCCHLEPKTGKLAVTGAEDEMAYVWETHTGDVVLHCKGHKVGAVFVSHSV